MTFLSKLLTYFLLCGVFTIPAISSQKLTYLLDPFAKEILATNGINCTSPGKTCDGCDKVSYCVQLPDGNWIKEELYACSEGYTCLESLKECTTDPNPQCDSNVVDYKFICHQVGIFPDPFDCKTYHMCLPTEPGSLVPIDEASSYKCGKGYGFDPLRGLCRIKLVNEVCAPFIPACNVTGQTGRVPGNPSMYYICLKNENSPTYFPQIFFCPFNQEYNGERCVDPTPPNGLDIEGKCVDKGLFVDSLSCKSLLDCSGKGALPTRRHCEAGSFFDHKVLKCVPFQC